MLKIMRMYSFVIGFVQCTIKNIFKWLYISYQIGINHMVYENNRSIELPWLRMILQRVRDSLCMVSYIYIFANKQCIDTSNHKSIELNKSHTLGRLKALLQKTNPKNSIFRVSYETLR